MNKLKVLALCGKSASGKDTYLKEIMKLSQYPLHEIVSCTTRPPRDYEVDGVNYYFLTNEEFAKQIENGDMLEATVFRDWCYGTSKHSLKTDKINVGVFNVDGIDILYDNPQIDLFVVYVYASDKTRLIRSLNREENPDIKEIIRRYNADEIDFEHFYGDHLWIDNDSEQVDFADIAGSVVASACHHWAKSAN